VYQDFIVITKTHGTPNVFRVPVSEKFCPTFSSVYTHIYC